jgi:hypothetical protein
VWSRFLVGFTRPAPRIHPTRTRRRTRQVRYIPDLLSLSEARELAMASGYSVSEAENDITRALRERKIRFKRAFEQVTFRGHTVDPEQFRRMTVEDGNRFRLRVPADLVSGDLDWENSRPRRPWPLGEGYFAHIARLELSRSDLEREFRPAANEVSKEVRREASTASAGAERAETRSELNLTTERATGHDASETSLGLEEVKRIKQQALVDLARKGGKTPKAERPQVRYARMLALIMPEKDRTQSNSKIANKLMDAWQLEKPAEWDGNKPPSLEHDTLARFVGKLRAEGTFPPQPARARRPRD